MLGPRTGLWYLYPNSTRIRRCTCTQTRTRSSYRYGNRSCCRTGSRACARNSICSRPRNSVRSGPRPSSRNSRHSCSRTSPQFCTCPAVPAARSILCPSLPPAHCERVTRASERLPDLGCVASRIRAVEREVPCAVPLAHSPSKDGSRIDSVAYHFKAVSERAAVYAAAFGAADESQRGPTPVAVGWWGRVLLARGCAWRARPVPAPRQPGRSARRPWPVPQASLL